jgi:hypothetical protein
MCSATLLPDPDSPLTRIAASMSRLATPGDLAALPRRVVGFHFLVLDDAAVELVGQQVDGGVHVFLGGLGMDGVAAHMQCGFGLLSELLNGENAMHVDYVIEMTRNTFELLLDVRAH